jgi:hypothetical protein
MKRALEVGGDYDGKFESSAQLIAMDDELQNHRILYALILGGSLHTTFLHLNKSNHVNCYMPAHPLHAASGFTIMVCGRRG